MAGQLKSFIGSIRKKPSRAPDRRSDADAGGGASTEKTSLTHDIAHLGVKNARTVAEAITTLASGEPLDDKELMLEHGVSMLQSLPLNSGLSDAVSKGFIKMLWHDLPHPAATLAGPAARYREHDGRGNNPWNPDMGKAGSPYCRNVPPMKPKGPNLPDPELVFEQLLKRNGPFREHPSGLNRLFFSFATVVIHECFQTSRTDQWINETSSYVDLSTLYGNTAKEQVRVRTYENGLLYKDAVASERIMMMPPGVVALCVLFSRNHNTIAKDLLAVNEQGKYRDWNSLSEEEQKWQDNDIFQVARNINVGFFATIVLHDYVAAILNTPRADSTWSLDLGGEIRNAGNRVERGTGNVVSVEFAVLYHWHAALSAADDKWMEGMIRQVLPDLGSMDDLSVQDFNKVVMTAGHKLMSTPPKLWTFGGLERGEDGSFNDAQLAEVIKDCIEEPAHAFGAHGTPNSLRIVDIMGQMQARDMFNVCTMNEFREYLNLKPYSSFEDWNPDKETARAAELLYGHIDNLELYPGLMAEVTKPAMPGSGVCPGQTTGRGILDDAVSLVRGDRFLSYDLNSNTLSNWGVGKISELPPGSYGGMLPQLLFNALPSGFPGTSAYALLPFYTPKAAQGILKQNKVIGQYKLERPPSDHILSSVFTTDGCTKVLADRENFHPISPSGGPNFMAAWDSPKKFAERSKMWKDVFPEENFEANVFKFFSESAARQIKQCSLKYSGSRRYIDVVRDVTNVTPIDFVADRFAIPLKTMDQPRGLVEIPQVYNMFLALFMYQSFDILPVNEWRLRQGAERAAPTLQKIFETHLKTQQGFKETVVDWMAKGSAFEVGANADRLYHALNKSGQALPDLVNDCLGVAAPMATALSRQASLLIDLFLQPAYAQYKDRVVSLSRSSDDAVSRKELEGFVLEGIRLAPAVPGLPRRSSTTSTVCDGVHGDRIFQKDQTVLVATSQAGLDPTVFPDPQTINPARPRESYAMLEYGLHFVFGSRLALPALTAMVAQVFRLTNIRRAPGRLGRFTTVPNEVAGVTVTAYIDANAKESPVPTTMTLEYDEEGAALANGAAAAPKTNGLYHS